MRLATGDNLWGMETESSPLTPPAKPGTLRTGKVARDTMERDEQRADWVAIRSRVHRIVRALVPSPAVEDVVQNVLVLLFRRISGNPSPIRDRLNYASHVAKSSCRRWHWERLRRAVSVHVVDPDRLAGLQEPAEPPRDWDGLASLMPGIHLALAGRPRDVFERIFFRGLSVKQTAQVLGLQLVQVQRSLDPILAVPENMGQKRNPPLNH